MIKVIKRHKIISLIVLAALIGGGYYGYNKLTGGKVQTSYVTSAVLKGTLITSVSSSGQISASNQVDIKAKASGNIIKVNVIDGQAVKSGQIIVQLDATDAYKTIRDANTSLASAKLAMEKLKQPSDQLSLTQAENALFQAKQSKQNAEDDLAKAYDDGFNTIANAFLDLPNIITGLHDILFNYTFGTTQQNIDFYADNVKDNDPAILNYKNDALDSYNQARVDYDRNFITYKAADRLSDKATIENLLDQTYNTAKNMADAVKSINNFIQFYEDNLSKRSILPPAAAATQLSSLNTYTGKTNTQLSNLLAIRQTIQTDKETILSSGRAITEKTQSLEKLKAGTDPLDIKSQELTIEQRQNSLYDAQRVLVDYTVRAPFDGVIAAVNLKVGDSASGAAIATIITEQHIAEISLNEVDMAKIKIGNKVTLTFDAIDGLSVSGEVAGIDALGAVSQGVVTYNVKIIFDTQDQRVKSGMSTNATIITAAKIDVLTVPNAAVKTDLGGSYVQILDSTGNPQNITVQIGLVNDTETEITSGLNESDKVITQTVNSAAAKATTQQSGGSTFRIPGIGGR